MWITCDIEENLFFFNGFPRSTLKKNATHAFVVFFVHRFSRIFGQGKMVFRCLCTCVENPGFRDRSSETSEINYEATRLRTPETTQNLCPFHRFNCSPS